MKVKVFVVNENTAAQYFGLKNADENQALYYAPNHWKTEKGAVNWAKKHGYEVI